MSSTDQNVQPKPMPILPDLAQKSELFLYDTLINDMTTNELVAVLAHEIGHYKKHHVIWSLLLGTLQTGIVLFIFSLFVGSPELSAALGVEAPSFHIGADCFWNFVFAHFDDNWLIYECFFKKE